MVVCSVVVVGAELRFTVSCVVVVVVVGAGFSTTVVQEVKKAAAMVNEQARIVGFFIISVVPSRDESAQVPHPDVFRTRIFRPRARAPSSGLGTTNRGI